MAPDRPIPFPIMKVRSEGISYSVYRILICCKLRDIMLRRS